MICQLSFKKEDGEENEKNQWYHHWRGWKGFETGSVEPSFVFGESLLFMVLGEIISGKIEESFQNNKENENQWCIWGPKRVFPGQWRKCQWCWGGSNIGSPSRSK